MKTLSIQRPRPSIETLIPAATSVPVKAAPVNWLPWSVLKISGLPQRASASSNASTQNAAFRSGLLIVRRAAGADRWFGRDGTRVEEQGAAPIRPHDSASGSVDRRNLSRRHQYPAGAPGAGGAVCRPREGAGGAVARGADPALHRPQAPEPARARPRPSARRGLGRLYRHDLRRNRERDRGTAQDLPAQVAAEVPGGRRQPGGSG